MLSYDELEGVSKVNEAVMMLLEYMRPETSIGRLDDIRQQLLTYWELDKWATVEVSRVLRDASHAPASLRKAPMHIRPETPADIPAIRDINIAAFLGHPISHQTEHLIVEALRDAGALEISLVAEVDDVVVGHVALSLGKIGETSEGWYLLGPIAVLPEWQGRGVGRALMEAALAQLRVRGAAGCMLVGNPDFYERFGFRSYERVTCEGVPARNVLVLPLSGEVPAGEIWHHPAYWTQPE